MGGRINQPRDMVDPHQPHGATPNNGGESPDRVERGKHSTYVQGVPLGHVSIERIGVHVRHVGSVSHPLNRVL